MTITIRLLPCPELFFILLDWSRTFPKPGGLPDVLIPIANNAISGNIMEVKRLSFAQQILSGLSDEGSFGGEAMSDSRVRIGDRNDECIKILKEFINEYRNTNSKTNSKSNNNSNSNNDSNSNDGFKIAIVYGPYHIQDLASKILKMGYKLSSSSSSSSSSSLTAWSMKYPSLFNISSSSSSSSSSLVSVSSGNVNQFQPIEYLPLGFLGIIITIVIIIIIIIITIVSINIIITIITILIIIIGILYLGIGALDYWVLLRVIISIIRGDNNYNDDVDQLLPSLVLGIGYLYLYILRHVLLSSSLSSLSSSLSSSSLLLSSSSSL